MGKLKNLLIDTAEDEAFNDIERQAKQRKEAVLQALHDENERLGLYKDVYGEKSVAMTELMDELAIARVCIRELGDRLSKLERGNEPATCPVCSATAYPYPKCGCVFYKEKNT